MTLPTRPEPSAVNPPAEPSAAEVREAPESDANTSDSKVDQGGEHGNEPKQPPRLSLQERTQRIDWLIDHFHEQVFRYAIRLAGNHGDGEDLAQQTFLIAQEKIEQLRDPSKSKSWLLTICRNRFLKDKRKRQPKTSSETEVWLDEIPDLSERELEFDEEKLLLGLESLPDESRIVLLMFYFEELSYREIAEQLDVKIGTVMSRLSRAKARLREALIGDWTDSGSPAPTDEL